MMTQNYWRKKFANSVHQQSDDRLGFNMAVSMQKQPCYFVLLTQIAFAAIALRAYRRI